jgi:hypothetical protein
MKEIEQAFLETNYIIKFESNIILKIGELPTQLIHNFPEIKTWAFITAWNPLPDILTKAQNDIRNLALKKQMIEDRYVLHTGIGISKNEDWLEESFFIENITLNKANAVSAKYGQLAFLYGDQTKGNQLIFTVF